MASVEIRRIAVIQTAFLGDVILTLPLVQLLKRRFASSTIDVVVIPRAAAILSNHPDITRTIPYDKRSSEKGLVGFWNKAKELRAHSYDTAFVPHRSLRSAALAYSARIPNRVGFNSSAGTFMLTKVIPYHKNHHEYRRNLDLMQGIEGASAVDANEVEYPRLFPSVEQKQKITELLAEWGDAGSQVVAFSPGTVWNTKRWLSERFAELATAMIRRGKRVALIGGQEDARLCEGICAATGSELVKSFAGILGILESAELIKRSALLISNDSAPVHMAVAMGTPVIAIFGATVPEFGFAPYGKRDAVVEIKNLSCKPCSIHGGDKCPIGTFECMKSISAEQVLEKALQIVP